MRGKKDEFFWRERSERSGYREREQGREKGEQEREMIRVGQVEPVKLIIEVN